MYNVIELMDERAFSLPQELKYRPSVSSHQDEGVQLLSSISSVPSVALRVVWPWTLIENIVSELLQNSNFEGFRTSIPPSSGYVIDTNNNMNRIRKDCDPMAFSFWLAAKMPMSEDDRLDLLELRCTVERLIFIRQLIRSQEKFKYIKCAHCYANIGQVSDIFTFNGADGTNGAYVNKHGIIHQTWTLRETCENSIFITGDSEVQDR